MTWPAVTPPPSRLAPFFSFTIFVQQINATAARYPNTPPGIAFPRSLSLFLTLSLQGSHQQADDFFVTILRQEKREHGGPDENEGVSTETQKPRAYISDQIY